MTTSELASLLAAKNARMPHSLLDLCLTSVSKNLDNYTSIVLPNELTLRLLALLIRAKQLNNNTLMPFLHSDLRTLDLR
jgi:hypothetical protein